ncbi:gb [Venturia nashicola]|uniref:Inheritance of peroxisomes protein 1 n=1 Tax=Venturia nashicola TaxID=86259 RepID=A0A4Z1P0E4_9PEZI|nr:gb [Venturia nashicola]TLD35037.1 gb [Venturia nashicola]
MASLSPKTPGNATRLANRNLGVRRVNTLPSKLLSPSARSSPSVGPSLDSVETLFVHAGTKVVSFTAQSTSSTRPGSSAGRRHGQDAASGTLAWDSPSERTMAAGPLRIYRVPSSGVSFLNSGSLLHPILPRSQCWCVDDKSTFVLRVREGSFYRIELPFETEEERTKVDEFRSVLATVLLFERTPSPFRRGYVEEEARPQTPIRRLSVVEQPKAKKWRLNKVWEPEDVSHKDKQAPVVQGHLLVPERGKNRAVDSDGSSQSGESTGDEDTITDGSVQEEDEYDVSAKRDHRATAGDSKSPNSLPFPVRVRPMPRSVTAPPPLGLGIVSPSSSIPLLNRRDSQDTDTQSSASSGRDSFYSMDGSPSLGDLQESQPEPVSNHTLSFLKEHTHRRQISEATIVPDTPTPLSAHSLDFPHNSSHPTTPPLIDDTDSNSSDHETSFQSAPTPPDTLRLHRLPRRLSSASATSSTIALEPLNSPKLFSTPRQPNAAQLISTALVQKAYSLIVGPPVHLVHVMLEIAARIMHGVRWDSPIVFGERVEKVPGGWIEDDEWSGDESEEEDDFGIPLSNLRRGSDVSQSSRNSRASFASSSRKVSVNSVRSPRADASPVSSRSSGSSVD